MSVVTVEAKSFELTCPKCKEAIPAPCGSLYWTAEELSLKDGIQCVQCGAFHRVPARLK